MIENIKINVMGEERLLSKGSTFLELSKMYQSRFEHPIIIAKHDGVYKELSDVIKFSGTVEFFDYNDREANRIYLNGLVYIMIYAASEVWNDCKIKTKHSIDKGLYIETSVAINEDKLKQLKNKIDEIIHMDLPIDKLNVNRLEAIEYFKRLGDESKTGLMKYSTNSYVTLYKLGDMYNFFFSEMPTSTGMISLYDVKYVDDHGFVLLFPTVYMEGKLKEYVHHPMTFKVFADYHQWAQLMKIENAASLNKFVSSGDIGNLIRMNETLQNGKLLDISKGIGERKNDVRIIFIAGPSSSGKTTTCNKLGMYLKSIGLKPYTISMDDYFLARKDTPKDKDGHYAYESLEALDIPLFDKQMKELLEGKEVLMPIYNFITGEPEFKKKLKIEENGILMIEGIHALNPALLTNVEKEKKYKIYISPLTGLNIDNHNRISTTDNRLLRRIIRDNKTRGYNVDATLKQWPVVRKGEEENIFPYQDEADITFNSALIYELGVLKTYVEPLLYAVDSESEYYHEAKRLINMLKLFLPIPSEDIPDDSILREFIGGSCF